MSNSSEDEIHSSTSEIAVGKGANDNIGNKNRQSIHISKAASLRGYEDAPVRLQRINFENIEHTHNDALEKETDELFKARNIRELVQMAYQARNHIQEMGLFKEANVVLDVDRRDGKPHYYELTFVVTEPTLNGSAWVGGNPHSGEAQTTASLKRKSIFGRGETVSSSYTVGHRYSSLFNLTLNKPLLGWQRYSGFNLTMSRENRDNPWGKFSILDNSLTAEFYHRFNPDFRYSGKWVGAARFVSASTDDTAFSIREHSGYSLKSSIVNSLVYSTLNSNVVPTSGMKASVEQEWAGLGGDVRFVQHSTSFAASTKLFAGLILHGSLSATHVASRSGPSLRLPDRVWLGGASNMRGFSLNRIGSQEDGCYLGGDSRWVGGVHLIRPLWPPRILFGHVFAVAGNIHGVEDSELREVIRSLAQSPRVSLGAGIFLNFTDRIRVELNYTVPVRKRATDDWFQGFQFGAGISFNE